MNRWTNLILGVLLVAQLVVAVVLASTGGGLTATTSGPLLTLEDAGIDTIVIASAEDDRIKLVKQDDGWHVPAEAGFPAAKYQVRNLLDNLKSLQAQLPVATSRQARERFKVGEGQYARRITLKSGGDTIATIYFGESAGPGEVYARVARHDAIYEVNFELWSASTDAGQWLDSTYLHRTTVELARVELPGITLEHKANAWQIVNVPKGKTTDVKKTGGLVSDLTTVAFAAMVGMQQEMQLSEPEFSYTLVTKDGDKVTYRFRKQPVLAEKGGDKKAGDDNKKSPTWLLTTSDSNYVFRINDNEVERLRDFKRSELVMAVEHKGQSVDKENSKSQPDAGSQTQKAESPTK